MTVAVPAGASSRPRLLGTFSRLAAVVSYTLRSCVGPRRWLGCLLPCAGALLIALIVRLIDEPVEEAFAHAAYEVIFALVLPIAALVIGDAVLGAEVRSGVFHFTWLSPTSFTVILLGRWLGGVAVALVSVVPAAALAAVVAGVPGAAPAMALATFAAAAAYVAVFIAIGTVARRAAVWSLAFVFLVERLLGEALTAVAQWSPQWEARMAYADLAPDVPTELLREGIPVGTGAIARLVVITVAFLLIARWRLTRMRLAGASD